MRISEPTQVSSFQHGGSSWQETYKQKILAWLNEMQQDPALAGNLDALKISCDRIFSILDGGKPPMKDAAAMNSYIDAHFAALFNNNGKSIYSGHMDPGETYSRLKELFTNLDFTPEQLAELPQAPSIQNFKYNLDHVALPPIAGEGRYDFKGDWETQGYIRRNIADPIFSEIDQEHITTEAGVRQFIQQNKNLQTLLGPQIYVNDPDFKKMVASGKADDAYHQVQDLYQALGLDPNSAPKPSGPLPPPPQDLQQFKNDLGAWLHEAAESSSSPQGSIGKIVGPILDEVNAGHITSMDGVRDYIKSHNVEGQLSQKIYTSDNYLKAMSNDAAYIEVQKLYQILNLPRADVPLPPGPTPPPGGDTLRIMTYNFRTSDASYGGGEDAGVNNPHFWAKRQQGLYDQIMQGGEPPAIINCQEGTVLQMEGGTLPGTNVRGKGILEMLNAGQQPPDRFRVLYAKDASGKNVNDDAIIYDSTKVKPVNAKDADKVVALTADKYGTRYAHEVAFTDIKTNRNLIDTNAHAQKWDKGKTDGGLTAHDADIIAQSMAQMASDFHASLSIFAADANRGDLDNSKPGSDGYRIQQKLENNTGLKNAYDGSQYTEDSHTSGLWDSGPGPHGRREDVLYTNGIITNVQQGARPDPKKPASDHVPVWMDVQI